MNPLSKDIHTFTKYYGSDQIPFVRSGAIQENTSQVTWEIPGTEKDIVGILLRDDGRHGRDDHTIGVY